MIAMNILDKLIKIEHAATTESIKHKKPLFNIEYYRGLAQLNAKNDNDNDQHSYHYNLMKLSAFYGVQQTLEASFVYFKYTKAILNEALEYAIAGGHLNLVKYLYEGLDAVVYTKHIFSIIYAQEKGYTEIIEYLREQKLDMYIIEIKK